MRAETLRKTTGRLALQPVGRFVFSYWLTLSDKEAFNFWSDVSRRRTGFAPGSLQMFKVLGILGLITVIVGLTTATGLSMAGY